VGAQDDEAESIQYYKESLNLFSKVNDQRGIAEVEKRLERITDDQDTE